MNEQEKLPDELTKQHFKAALQCLARGVLDNCKDKPELRHLEVEKCLTYFWPKVESALARIKELKAAKEAAENIADELRGVYGIQGSCGENSIGLCLTGLAEIVDKQLARIAELKKQVSDAEFSMGNGNFTLYFVKYPGPVQEEK